MQLNQNIFRTLKNAFKTNKLTPCKFYSVRTNKTDELFKEIEEQQQNSKKAFNSSHIYNKLYPWKDSKELATHLYDNITYNKDGLIGINKPYGLAIHASNVTPTKTNVVESSLTFDDALPHLTKLLKLGDLVLIKPAERYTSGISLLTPSQTIYDKVIKSISRAKPQKKPYLYHWIICQGYPQEKSATEKIGIRFNPEDEPELIINPSKYSIKERNVFPAHIQYNLLDVNQTLSSSLIEIATTSIKGHTLRVYLTSKIACIMGDVLNSSRVNTILGKTIKRTLNKKKKKDIQFLPGPIAEKLKVPLGAAGHMIMPVMIHRNKILLPDYYAKNEDLEISAPLPPYFEWTLNKLDLKVATPEEIPEVHDNEEIILN